LQNQPAVGLQFALEKRAERLLIGSNHGFGRFRKWFILAQRVPVSNFLGTVQPPATARLMRMVETNINRLALAKGLRKLKTKGIICEHFSMEWCWELSSELSVFGSLRRKRRNIPKHNNSTNNRPPSWVPMPWTAHNLSDAMRAKLDTLDLQAGQIKDELAKDGQVVRRKALDIGAKAADAASDARAVAEIKAKYAKDSTLSAWDISVSCDQGHVKLSGTVQSTEDIGRAVALALEADGVRDATSTLTVKPKQ